MTLDFETRSEAKLRRVGAYAYAAHPSTRANCLAFAFDDEDEVHLWHPAFPGLPEHRPDALGELFDRVALGDEVEAHDAMFERCVWRFVMRGRHGWPEPDADQWRCSAALQLSRGTDAAETPP